MESTTLHTQCAVLCVCVPCTVSCASALSNRIVGSVVVPIRGTGAGGKIGGAIKNRGIIVDTDTNVWWCAARSTAYCVRGVVVVVVWLHDVSGTASKGRISATKEMTNRGSIQGCIISLEEKWPSGNNIRVWGSASEPHSALGCGHVRAFPITRCSSSDVEGRPD